MTAGFSSEVQTIVGPLLAELGFVLDEVDDSPDQGGIERHIVYYRSSDCKMQIYEYSREGEVNSMIATLDAPNEFGLTSKQWHYISKFSKRSDVPPQERLRLAIAEANTYANPLEWVRDRIAKYYESAHAGILEMYGFG
ncbi:hypothetical protein [Mycobacterium terramassiliense]|uniref:Uncharacterized protein n=1 Tax=Mycobacterium terramassiliense TaxID=1841859 RepID=A0A2U3N9U3_9MYCO|nr:hypothetical protein [Mycobacterium terramassiliense]SPM28260.1 hypothetical protein MTAB308_1746 [Mycobacterium terramassiliense]